MYRINEIYDLEHTIAKEYLSQFTYPWEALSGIKDLILKLGEGLDKEEYTEYLNMFGYIRQRQYFHLPILVHHVSLGHVQKYAIVHSSDLRHWLVQIAS